LDGPIQVDIGDVIQIKGVDSTELHAFTLLLALSMTKKGDIFSGLTCDVPQNVIYILGRGTKEKL